MGSVKDLEVIIGAFENLLGIGRFRFSDRYSVFDWGEMPDKIKNKGKALAVMAAYNFEELAKLGIRSHYKGLVVDDGCEFVLDLSPGCGDRDIGVMEVDLGVKYMPIERRFWKNDELKTVYDYSFYDANRGNLNNFLVPLEIIYRNGLPKGSSVFKNLKKAGDDASTRRAILKRLGLTKDPIEGDMLPKPIIEYWTKLEPGDRLLDYKSAYRISGLNLPVFRQIKDLALKVNDFITKRAADTGLDPHWDGKVEMLYCNGNLALADVTGTLDEDRFGDNISKELLRQWYEKNQPEWRPACEEAKTSGEGWQKRCPITPIKLPEHLVELVSQMYMAACNQYIGKDVFREVPRLEKVLENLKPYRE